MVAAFVVFIHFAYAPLWIKTLIICNPWFVWQTSENILIGNYKRNTFVFQLFLQLFWILITTPYLIRYIRGNYLIYDFNEFYGFQGPHSYGVLTFIESGVCGSVALWLCLFLTHFLWAVKSHVTSHWITDFLDTNLISDN